MKKYLVSIFLLLVLLFATPAFVKTTFAQDMSLKDFIQLLISIGVITQDKVPAVNAFLASYDAGNANNQSGSSSLGNTDSTIKEALSNLKFLASTYYNLHNNSYSGFCGSDSSTFSLPAMRQCGDSTNYWVAYAQQSTGYFCADSSGIAKNISSPLLTKATSCADQVSTITTPVSIAINDSVQYGVNKNEAFVTTSIASGLDNKKVTSWSLRADCPAGVSLSVRSAGTDVMDKNICGNTMTYKTSDFYDISQGASLLTAGAKNTNNNISYVGFALIAYDTNGNNIGGDKDVVQLNGVYSSNQGQTSAQVQPSISINSSIPLVGNLVKGTGRTISWQTISLQSIDLNNFPVDISLVGNNRSYIIANKVNVSYTWNIGDFLYPDGGDKVYSVPSGAYTLKVCQSNTSNCASSAGFNIIDNTSALSADLIDLGSAFPYEETRGCPNPEYVRVYNIPAYPYPVVIKTATKIHTDDYLRINGVLTGDKNTSNDCGSTRYISPGDLMSGIAMSQVIPAGTPIKIELVDSIGVVSGASGKLSINRSDSSVDTSRTVTTQNQPTITPTQSTVSSGQNVRLVLSSPYASHSSIYFACPTGVSMGSSCNTYINTTSNSDWSPLFINTTSQNQNVAVNYTVYTSSGDTNPSIASANITVLPSSPAVPATTSNCSKVFSGVTFTGVNNTVGLSNGDSRFYCLNNNFYECGWESNNPAFATKATDGQVVGNFKCNLNSKSWTSQAAAPSIPSNLTAFVTPPQEGTSCRSGITLSWTGSTNVATYNIYRWTGTRRTGATVVVNIANVPAPQTTFTDTTAAPGVKYEYAMYATNSAGAKSVWNITSAQDGAIATVPVCSNTIQPTISYVQAPAEDNNVIHPGESTRIFGANFSANSTVTVFIGNYSASGSINSDGSQVSFIVPTIPAGTYNLYVTDHVFTTNSVSVSVPSSNVTQPSITVISPNGGESWKAGETHNITWTSTGLDSGSQIQIGLRDSRYDPNIGSGEQTLVYSMNNTGSYSWVIPQQVMNGGGSNVYKVVAYIANKDIADLGDNYFTINPPAAVVTNPSITITSPNGGETFTSSQSIPVKWNMNYANTGASIIVRLLKDGSGNVFDSQPIRGVSGSNTFSIPAGSVGAGSYRAEVVDNPGMGGNDAYDDGDGYFTVAAPVPPCLNGAGALLPGQSYCSSSASSAGNQSLGVITTIPNQVSCKFDATKYADYYPDLKRAFGYDQAKLKSHWLINGLGEGRTPCGADMPTCKFNSATYLSYNPDVVRAGLDGKYHYTTYGVNEGRDVCRSTTAAANDNVASVNIAFDDIMKLIQALKK